MLQPPLPLISLLGWADLIPAVPPLGLGPAMFPPLVDLLPPLPPPPHSSSRSTGTQAPRGAPSGLLGASQARSWHSLRTAAECTAEGCLSQAQSTQRLARVIIAPHAGYTSCESVLLRLTNKWTHLSLEKSRPQALTACAPLSCAISRMDIYRKPL